MIVRLRRPAVVVAAIALCATVAAAPASARNAPPTPPAQPAATTQSAATTRADLSTGQPSTSTAQPSASTGQPSTPPTTDVLVHPKALAALQKRAATQSSPDLNSADATKVTRVLVILAAWGARDSTTPALAKKIVITDSNAWYRATSYGRQGLTGDATPWVKVPEFECGSFGVFGSAEAAARKLGYNPSHYGRIVVYTPCDGGGVAGIGDEPGNRVLLLDQGMSLRVATHEQGHNYGLAHANYYYCSSHGEVAYIAGAKCSSQEYGDETSAMGASNYVGDFTAPQKAFLGWLHYRTITSGSVTLGAYELSTGTQAVKIRGTSGRTYWLEYRTHRGDDIHLPTDRLGVIVHMSEIGNLGFNSGQSLLLDMLPAGPGLADSSYGIPVGSSWTTPEGIRFAVTSETSGSARITITRGLHPHVPGVPSTVSAKASDGAAIISFHRASDGGKVIRDYVITRTGGVTKTVHNFGSASTVTATFTGLKNGTRYSFNVRAHNQLGTGAPSRAVSATPAPMYPGVTITAPAANASVSGLVTIGAKGIPNAVTKRAISRLDFYVDGGLIDEVYKPSATVRWNTGAYPGYAIGAHTIKVVAVDSGNRSRTASITVHLTQTTGPVLTLTSPVASATLQGTVHVAGAVTPNGHALSGMEFDVDGQYVDQIAPGTGTWSYDWDTNAVDNGTHTISVIATDTAGNLSVRSESVIVKRVPPTVTITSPAAGGTVSGSSHVLGTVTNHSTVAGLEVDVDYTSGGLDQTVDTESLTTAPGASDVLDLPLPDVDYIPAGSYPFKIIVTDGNGAVTTVTRTLTVVHPNPQITPSTPAVTGSLSGIVDFSGRFAVHTGSAEVTVEFDVDGDWTDSSNPDVAADGTGSYDFQYDVSALDAGMPHDFAIKIIDSLGNSVTASYPARTIVHPAATLVWSAPAAGPQPPGAVDLSGTVTDNSTVDDLYVNVLVGGNLVEQTYVSVAAGATAPWAAELSGYGDASLSVAVQAEEFDSFGTLSAPITRTLVVSDN